MEKIEYHENGNHVLCIYYRQKPGTDGEWQAVSRFDAEPEKLRRQRTTVQVLEGIRLIMETQPPFDPESYFGASLPELFEEIKHAYIKIAEHRFEPGDNGGDVTLFVGVMGKVGKDLLHIS